jgi:hypothetical protein
MMQFSSPYMLWILLAIPILIIIHTLKPKPRPVDVTNLFLWTKVIKERRRNVSFERLKRNLPLLLQILIAGLAAVALAKPTWTHLTARKGNMVLVMDTSASMKARSEFGARFDQARKKALDLIEERDLDQKILIVEAGKKPVVKSGFIENSSHARDVVKKLQATDAAVNLEPAIYLALSFVDPVREDSLYLITDGAAENFSALIKNHPNIQPIIIAGGEQNIGITKFEFRQLFDHRDQYEFLLEIKNFDPSPLECPIRISIDGVGLFDRVISFGAEERKRLIIPYSGLINGIARATLNIEDDFEVDNQAYLALTAVKDIWVLLVSKGNDFLEKLLAAYPNVRVNSVKEIIPSSWHDQTARHDIVIVDRMNFPQTDRGNFLLIDAYSPSVPIAKTGRVRRPEILDWDRKNALMANVNLSGLIIEEGAKLQADDRLKPVIASDRTGLMYEIEKNALRVVLLGFDISKSDLPLKVAYPVMMSNIFNWLNPHKLEFSTFQIQAGETFDIYSKPQTDVLFTRAPNEKWEKHQVKTNPLEYQNTGTVGVYTIAENGKERYFTVNLADESESDIASTALTDTPDQSEISPISEKTFTDRPIWMLFILVSCAVLIFEWYAWLRLR